MDVLMPRRQDAEERPWRAFTELRYATGITVAAHPAAANTRC
jgi:hypothetical protein